MKARFSENRLLAAVLISIMELQKKLLTNRHWR